MIFLEIEFCICTLFHFRPWYFWAQADMHVTEMPKHVIQSRLHLGLLRSSKKSLISWRKMTVVMQHWDDLVLATEILHRAEYVHNRFGFLATLANPNAVSELYQPLWSQHGTSWARARTLKMWRTPKNRRFMTVTPLPSYKDVPFPLRPRWTVLSPAR